MITIAKPTIIIGIDPGVNTGFAVWNTKKKELIFIDTLLIHEAMREVSAYQRLHHNDIFVRVEDARKRNWFGNAGREQLQGAGSIKRDCKIWEDFLTDSGIAFDLVPPKNNKTKMKDDAFKKITGWRGVTSYHGRDAALLVFGM